MKLALFLSSLFISLSCFATENAPDAMKEIFQEGFYMGKTPKNALCSLHVRFADGNVVVTAANETLDVSRTVLAGTAFRFNKGRREFLSSDASGTFRTLAVDRVRTFTVTAEVDPDGKEIAVECIVPTEE